MAGGLWLATGGQQVMPSSLLPRGAALFRASTWPHLSYSTGTQGSESSPLHCHLLLVFLLLRHFHADIATTLLVTAAVSLVRGQVSNDSENATQ